MPKDDKKENISIKIGNAIKSLKKIYQNTNQNDEIENNENNNIPNSVIKLVNKHVKLDQAYRRKHNEQAEWPIQQTIKKTNTAISKQSEARNWRM